MHESTSRAAVFLYCQQPPTGTVNEISALEANKGPNPATQKTQVMGQVGDTQCPGTTRDKRIQKWDLTRQVSNLPSQPTFLFNYLGTRNGKILPNTVKK